MPIYTYKCATCGHADDVMQKMSDAVLTTCPQCGAQAYGKQLTAPGFALKGSGWYVTDFKGGTNNKDGSNKPAETKTETKPETAAAPAAVAPPAVSSTPAAPSAAPAAT